MPVLTPYLGMFLFTVGIALLLRGFFGWPQWTHPACAKCCYDLRGLDPELHRECPECGCNLAKPGAVRFGRARRSCKVMVLGVLFVLSPLFFIGGQQAQRTITVRMAQQRTNSAVIADLATNANDPQSWNELVFISAGDDQHEIGTYTAWGRASSRSRFSKNLSNIPADADTVDVVFRPDPKAVEGRAEWTEIWGEEIVIEDVPVIRPSGLDN